MPVHVEQVQAADAGLLIDALNDWAAPQCYVSGLHSGDVGWELRLAGDEGDSGLVVVEDAGELVAVALQDSLNALRPRIRPDRLGDVALASVLVDYVEGMPDDADAYTDAPVESALRSLLSGSGWQLDPHPWVTLYRPLSAADAALGELGEGTGASSAMLRSEEDIVDRVAVQRSAFTGSTFTVQRWHSMAAGPGFDLRYEYLRRLRDGTPVAAATGWSAGPGKCAILEPVGAAPDQRGAGHGKAVSLAVMGALARDGAGGVSVSTPALNEAAIRAYESCGLRQIEVARAMMRPRRSTDEARS